MKGHCPMMQKQKHDSEMKGHYLMMQKLRHDFEYISVIRAVYLTNNQMSNLKYVKKSWTAEMC